MKKKINSETRKYEEQVTDTLVLDAVPTVNSFNAVTSDAVARAIAGASGEVPQVTENDNGKVLTAIYDAGGPAVEWQEAQGGSSYTAGDGIAIESDEISVRVKDGGGLTFSEPSSGGEDMELVLPVGTAAEEGWKSLQDSNSSLILAEYDEDHNETTITFRYLWNGSDMNPLAIANLAHDDTKTYNAKLHLLYLHRNDDYTEIIATSNTLSDAFTAGWYSWDTQHEEAAIYSLGTPVETTDAGTVYEVSFTVPGEHVNDFNTLAFSASGTDMSNVADVAQSSFLSEDYVFMLQGDSVFIVGEAIPGGDLCVDIATEWNPYSDKIPTCSMVEGAISARVPSPEDVTDGAVLTAGYDSAQWEMPTKVEYANQELKVQPPSGLSLTIDTSEATPVTGTESYIGMVQSFNSSTLIIATTGWLGEKDLVSGTLHIPEDIEATGITLNDLELNYYQGDHGSYTEESVSPMVVTGATSASPSKILAGDYVIPVVPNPDPTYGTLCVKFTYSGSPDQADLDAFASALESTLDGWAVTGDMQAVTGYSIKPAVLPTLTGNAGKVLAVNSGATGTEWVEGIPASTSADEGKVLTVDNTGAATWATPAAPSGGSDDWWGGEPERIELRKKQIRLLFKDPTYDPRNDSDTTFLNRFTSITKEDDGSYTFTFKESTSNTKYARAAFSQKYLTDNEFVVLAWNTWLFVGEYTWRESYDYMFYQCTGLRAVYNVNQAERQNTDCTAAFYGCTNLVTYREFSDYLGDMPNYYIENGTSMFQGCTSLKDVFMLLAPASQWGGGSSSMNYTNMFNGCVNLECGPLIYGPAVSCNAMFRNCPKLREFSNFLISPASTTRYVAQDCNCASMFSNCTSLPDISKLSNFFSRIKISAASNMFAGCRMLHSIPFHLNLSTSGCSATGMFSGAISLLKLPDMDYELITGSTNMFKRGVILRDISPLSSVTWNASLTDVSSMFEDCSSIQKGLKDVYDGMAATATITTTNNCFSNCGEAFSNPDRALIPSSWGGTGT